MRAARQSAGASPPIFVVSDSSDGEIAKSGDSTLAEELEDKGYDWVRDEVYETA